MRRGFGILKMGLDSVITEFEEKPKIRHVSKNWRACPVQKTVDGFDGYLFVPH